MVSNTWLRLSISLSLLDSIVFDNVHERSDIMRPYQSSFAWGLGIIFILSHCVCLCVCATKDEKAKLYNANDTI